MKLSSSLSCLATLLLFSANTYAQNIITCAGIHTQGYTGNGGPATIAAIYQPNQVCTDKHGNLYIVESGNNVVRRVDAAGIIHLFAGNHNAGYSGDGGPATAAQLSGPTDVAVDAAGNVYIAEQINACVRKVDAAGIITTIAGTPTVAGYSGDGGPATAATFSTAFAINLDGAGNIYVADLQNNVVRKINTSGIISTFAGTYAPGGYNGDGGPATAALFNGPIDIACDKLGNVYIADISNSVVRKVDPSGIITTVAGNGTSGYIGDGMPATASELNGPYSICVDTNNILYITDNVNERIRKVNAAGIISTVAGNGIAGYSGDNGPATAAAIHNDGGICFDTSGNLYIADYGNNAVRKVLFNPFPAGVPTIQNATLNAIQLYPNPAADKVNIALESATAQNVRIAIYDLSGKESYNATYPVAKGTNNIVLDMVAKPLPAGNYYLVIHSGDQDNIVRPLTILVGR